MNENCMTNDTRARKLHVRHSDKFAYAYHSDACGSCTHCARDVYEFTLHDTHIAHAQLRETRIHYSRVYHPCPTEARDIALNMQTDRPFIAFIQTIINKGANFVLSANFAFWIVRTLFVPILQFRYFLVRKWSV
ncbi:unnamed protein product [Leptosia nina]|uniref:Uncharacterized protein n=1 Tax=Leptosia nina TaxID=320188 RepID=A0AAV1JNK5_9NEOP